MGTTLARILHKYTEGGATLSRRKRTAPKEEGTPLEDDHLMSDNGSQPMSTCYETILETLGIEHITTSYNNPKGNADTERFMRTFKEEVV